MYYPEKLKNRRLELGLKQTELAKQLGISKQSYFAWEKGTSQPTKANLLKRLLFLMSQEKRVSTLMTNPKSKLISQNLA